MTIEWEDDRIWCPSQCYGRFSFRETDYTVYLRWRWEDPWEATLVKHPHGSVSITDEGAEWERLVIPYFTDEQLPDLKEYITEHIINVITC